MGLGLAAIFIGVPMVMGSLVAYVPKKVAEAREVKLKDAAWDEIFGIKKGKATGLADTNLDGVYSIGEVADAYRKMGLENSTLYQLRGLNDEAWEFLKPTTREDVLKAIHSYESEKRQKEGGN